MHKFRASSLGDIMTDPKNKDDLLSVGGKTVVDKIAKQLVYGYDEVVTSKYMDKGIQVEDKSIELYNSVFFTGHAKNTERKTNDWITGECDIFTPAKITDIKSAWSLATFPATARQGEDKGYEWQLRAYMMLWDVDLAQIAYCLVNTPEELIGWEDPALHYIDHITPELRVTLVQYKRDLALEDKIRARCEAANEYLDLAVKKIAEEHNF
ncbi:MAG: hypothetical protein JJD98_00315 [Polaromonas sp.]|nr:hypothetical protein [Polaromonas sp.]